MEGVMDLLLLPHWLMIAGAALVALGFLGLVFARNKQAATNPDSESNVPPPNWGAEGEMMSLIRQSPALSTAVTLALFIFSA